jgi:hypothetical protein
MEQMGGYQVLWPRGEKTIEIAPLARRLDSLEGKTVCQLWDYLFRGDEIFALLEEELGARYPGINFVSYEEFGSTHGEDETKILEELPARLEALGVDAVISGMGC